MKKKQIITVIIGLFALWGIVDLLSNGVPVLDSILAIASVGIIIFAITQIKKIFDKTWQQGVDLAKTIKKVKNEKGESTMSTLGIHQYTDEEKVNILAECSKKVSKGKSKWVSFNNNGVSIYPFQRRLDSFDEEGLQEIYMVYHDEVRFLGFLIDDEWIKFKQVYHDPVKVAKNASRKIWSKAV